MQRLDWGERARRLVEYRFVIVGALAIAVTALVTFYPTLANGFFSDEFIRLDIAARMQGLDYWINYLDPRVQELWYRPMVGVQWKLEYLLFGANLALYHQVQILYHVVNCALLYGLVIRMTGRWRLGFIAALVYAVLPLASQAVYWAAVHDPLAGMFALLALLAWISYADSGSRLKYGLAYVAFIGAILSKEISLCLPVLMLIIEWLRNGRWPSLPALVRRYAGFALIGIVYVVIWYIVTTRSVFTQQIGVKIGTHVITVFLYYLSRMALPWPAPDPVRYAWLGLLTLIVVYGVVRVDRRWLLVAAAGTIPVLAVSPIPPYLTNTRYIYLPLMAWAVAMAWVADGVQRRLASERWAIPVKLGSAALIALVAWSASIATNELIVNYGGFTREVRLQFRPIFQQYATLPPDSFFYFFDTPMQAQDISGLFYLRYGANAGVGGVDRPEIIRLRDHQAAYVSYLNEENAFSVQPVEKSAAFEMTAALPARFGESIRLVSLEPVSARIKRSEPISLLMYFDSSTNIDRDYTLFIHLIDGAGIVVAGYDTQPHQGNAPTSLWRPNRVIAQGAVLPVDPGIPPGEYSLEVGWYFAPTGERLPILDSAGRQLSDKILIRTFTIE